MPSSRPGCAAALNRGPYDTLTGRAFARYPLSVPSILYSSAKPGSASRSSLTRASSALRTMRIVLTSRDVVVPSLVGEWVPKPRPRRATAGLALRIEGRRNDAGRAGRPCRGAGASAGRHAEGHRAVRVWMSLGPRHVSVPAVEGESVRTARLALDQGSSRGPRRRGRRPRRRGHRARAASARRRRRQRRGGVALLVSRGPRARATSCPTSSDERPTPCSRRWKRPASRSPTSATAPTPASLPASSSARPRPPAIR